ncbi:MAG: DUF6508 domain-containing protein [Bacteroidales bacterium]
MQKKNKNIDAVVIRQPEKLLDYIDFFTNIREDDYIWYADDHCFSYSPKFKSFIQQLYDSNMVESHDHLIDSITENGDDEHERCEAFSNWMREMNRVLSRPCELREANISFLRKAFFTLIRMEKIFPGSWSVDVESGTWLKLLKQFKKLYEAGEVKTEA